MKELSDTEAELKKNVAYKKKRVVAIKFNEETTKEQKSYHLQEAKYFDKDERKFEKKRLHKLLMIALGASLRIIHNFRKNIHHLFLTVI